jgi:hypothetical protein
MPDGASVCPATSTHQSNHTLDGFFFDQNGTNFQVKVASDPQIYGQLITDTSLNPHGYVSNGRHLSDHCPVWAELQIERAPKDMDMDTANIIGNIGDRRTRSKSYGTRMHVDNS